MTTLFEICAQFAIVVDLAVENYRDALVFVENRLFAGDQIDDREPAHSKGYAARHEQSFRVRSAMDHPLTHRVQQLLRTVRRRRVRIETGPTGDSAHEL